MVVLFHLMTIEQKYGGDSILPGIMSVGLGGVDLFFVISGFVMTTILQGKFGKLLNAKRFLLRRLTRIYPMYWIYTFIVLAVFLFKPNWVNSSGGGKFKLIHSVFLLPSTTLPVLIVGWSLIFEIYFYLVLTLLIFLPQRWYKSALVFWAISIALGSFIYSESPSPIVQLLISPLSLEFIVGCCIALVLSRQGNRTLPFSESQKKRLFLLFQFGIFFSFIFLITSYGLYKKHTGLIFPEDWIRILIFGLPAGLVLTSLVCIEKMHGWRMPKILIIIGDASYSIYLSHILVMSALGRIWNAFHFGGYYNNLVALPLIFVGSILTGWVSYIILEKPILNWTHRMLKLK